ncbi:MAG: hypothetical protein LBJ09_03540 [Clostridiales bacterium]|nr:hypothetical protein [Clostridiales bacterium]
MNNKELLELLNKSKDIREKVEDLKSLVGKVVEDEIGAKVSQGGVPSKVSSPKAESIEREAEILLALGRIARGEIIDDLELTDIFYLFCDALNSGDEAKVEKVRKLFVDYCVKKGIGDRNVILRLLERFFYFVIGVLGLGKKEVDMSFLNTSLFEDILKLDDKIEEIGGKPGKEIEEIGGNLVKDGKDKYDVILPVTEKDPVVSLLPPEKVSKVSSGDEGSLLTKSQPSSEIPSGGVEGAPSPPPPPPPPPPPGTNKIFDLRQTKLFNEVVSYLNEKGFEYFNFSLSLQEDIKSLIRNSSGGATVEEIFSVVSSQGLLKGIGKEEPSSSGGSSGVSGASGFVPPGPPPGPPPPPPGPPPPPLNKDQEKVLNEVTTRLRTEKGIFWANVKQPTKKKIMDLIKAGDNSAEHIVSLLTDAELAQPGATATVTSSPDVSSGKKPPPGAVVVDSVTSQRLLNLARVAKIFNVSLATEMSETEIAKYNSSLTSENVKVLTDQAFLQKFGSGLRKRDGTIVTVRDGIFDDKGFLRSEIFVVKAPSAPVGDANKLKKQSVESARRIMKDPNSDIAKMISSLSVAVRSKFNLYLDKSGLSIQEILQEFVEDVSVKSSERSKIVLANLRFDENGAFLEEKLKSKGGIKIDPKIAASVAGKVPSK